MKKHWPHAKQAQHAESRELSLLVRQAVGIRYQPAERSETLPKSYDADTTLSLELVY